jgi:WD40 repeat protein
MRAANNSEFLTAEAIDEHVPEIATMATSNGAALFDVSKTGAVAAAVCEDAQLFLWRLPDKQVVRQIDLAGRSIDALAMSPDGSMVATGDHAGSYSVWETSTGKRELHIETSFYPFRLGFSPDGSQLAIAAVGQPVRVYKLATAEKLLELRGATEGSAAVAFSADQARIATADGDTAVRIYRRDNHELLAKNTESLFIPLSAVFSKNSKTLLVVGADRTIRWLDANSGVTTRRSPKLADPVISLDLSPDGMYVSALLMHADNMLLPAPVLIWETRSGRKVQEWFPKARAIGGAWTQDGLLFATATNKLIHIWRVRQ